MVAFDTLDVFTDDGRRLLRAGFIFDLVRKLRPSLADGDAGESWLETTYLSERVRLGRGNKVSPDELEGKPWHPRHAPCLR